MSEQTTAMTVRAPQAVVALPAPDPQLVEQALTIGDVGKMSPAQRVAYYLALCQSMSLNPLTKPFTPIQGDDGSIQFYPNKSCAEQLRKAHRVSLKTTERRQDGDLYLVTIVASLPDGRTSEAQGAVSLVKQKGQWKTSQNGKRYFEAALDADGEPVYLPLRGDARANAMMKAETKAARRATLAICGLTDAPAHGQELQMQLTSGTFVVSESKPDEPADPWEAPRTPVADLFGDRPPAPKPTPPPPAQTEMHGVQDDPVLPQIQGGETYLDQINAVMRANGADDAAIQAYWQQTCRRCQVNSPVAIKAAWLPKLLDERREFYLKREQAKASTDWRQALTSASADLPDTPETVALWQEIAAALNSPDTPEDVGQDLLQRVQATAPVQVGK